MQKPFYVFLILILLTTQLHIVDAQPHMQKTANDFDLNDLNPIEWLKKIYNAIKDLPYIIYKFFWDSSTRTLNFISNILKDALNGISQIFGIAQPLVATVLAMLVFVAAYLVIRLILYIV